MATAAPPAWTPHHQEALRAADRRPAPPTGGTGGSRRHQKGPAPPLEGALRRRLEVPLAPRLRRSDSVCLVAAGMNPVLQVPEELLLHSKAHGA
jgi:hypothetical protein